MQHAHSEGPSSQGAPGPDAASPTLLVVEDHALTRRAVRRTAARQGFHVLETGTGEEGLEILGREDVDVVLVDQGLPGMLGVEFIREARQRHPTIDFILFTGDGDVNVGFAALEQGASDYFTKPIDDPKRFAQVLRRGVEARRLREENAHLQRRAVAGGGHAERILLGHSAQMEEVRSLVRRFARLQDVVLINGESGVGKDVVARALHAEGGRENGQYVAVNCGAIPAHLFESQLFGHEPGAFTGAVQKHRGFFEEAGEGTIFLDELGDLPLDMQVKLLRVIENRRFRPVGGRKEIAFRGRVLAATNRDLASMVEAGTFRQDLYYRLTTLRIVVPPLREHPEDIVILAYYFAKAKADELGRNVRAIHPDAMRAMMAYDWPGNVRELFNAVVRMVAWTDGETIGPAGLDDAILAAGRSAANARPAPAAGVGHGQAEPSRPASDEMYFPETMLIEHYRDVKKASDLAFSRWYLGEVLRRHGGNKTRAAKAAGMRRPNFVRELKKYGVEVPPDLDVGGAD